MVEVDFQQIVYRAFPKAGTGCINVSTFFQPFSKWDCMENFRPLNADEMELLRKLLDHDFPGRDWRTLRTYFDR